MVPLALFALFHLQQRKKTEKSLDKKKLLPKGQLISKYLFGIFNSHKKQMKKFNFTTMVAQVKWLLFVFGEN